MRNIAALILFSRLTMGAYFAVATEPNAEAAAEQLIREGIELRRLGDDQAALKKFESALETKETARTLAQLGLCELAVGRYAGAVTHLTAALGRKNEPWISRNQHVLRESLEQAKLRIARVWVKGEPLGSAVRVNGELVGVLPLEQPALVDEGTADIEVTADGFVTWNQPAAVQAGQTQEIFVRLKKVSPAPDNVALTRGGEHVKTGSSLGRAKWISGAAAVAALGVGTFGWIRHTDAVGDFDDAQCRIDAMGDPGFVTSDGMFVRTEACTEALERTEGFELLRTIGFIGAGVFAASGLVFHLLEGAASREPAQRALNLKCGPTGAAAFSCFGQF